VYRWLDHTSEAELWVEDETPEAVLGEAAIALGDLLGQHAKGEPVTHRVRLTASDMPALLADWLGELVHLAETDGFVPERVVKLELAGSSVDAVVGGQRTTPQTLVKAVTRRRLEFGHEPGGPWQARVVLDV
jgi:SHS2 domain-containing protein